MPALPSLDKPRLSHPHLRDIRALSNNRQHIGKRVRVVKGKFFGQLGVIRGAVTAVNCKDTGQYVGTRGVYYTVELPERIVEGYTWDYLIWLN